MEAEPFQPVLPSQRHRPCQIPLQGRALYNWRRPPRSMWGQTPANSYSLLWTALRHMQLAINMDFSFKANLKAISFLIFTGTTCIRSGTVFAEQLLRHQVLIRLPWSITGRILLFFMLCFPISCSASSAPQVTFGLSPSSFLASYTTVGREIKQQPTCKGGKKIAVRSCMQERAVQQHSAPELRTNTVGDCQAQMLEKVCWIHLCSPITPISSPETGIGFS